MTSSFHVEGVVVLIRDDGVVEYDYSSLDQLDGPLALMILQGSERELRRREVDLPRPLLVRMGRLTHVTRDARAVFAGSDEIVRIAGRTALLATNPVAVVVANFFMGLNRPRCPTRMFAREEAALEWLHQHNPSSQSSVHR